MAAPRTRSTAPTSSPISVAGICVAGVAWLVLLTLGSSAIALLLLLSAAVLAGVGMARREPNYGVAVLTLLAVLVPFVFLVLTPPY